jgi:outer membrane immunogenic protein
MKKCVLGAGVAFVLAATGANAADLPRGPNPYAPVVPFGVYSWAGSYVGANLGYQWGTTTNNPTDPSGIMGGIQLGHNWQNGQFVFGVETDLQLSTADDVFAPWNFSNPWFGTLRGRAGIAVNNILFYGTLGLAYGGVRGEVFGLSETRSSIGWAGGLGAEIGLTPNWSAKVEYLYVDLADRGFSVTGTSNGLESNILRMGVNYRF